MLADSRPNSETGDTEQSNPIMNTTTHTNRGGTESPDHTHARRPLASLLSCALLLMNTAFCPSAVAAEGPTLALSLSTNPNEVTLQFTATNGGSYRIESTTTTFTNFTELETLTGTGAAVSRLYSTSAKSNEFFRVVEGAPSNNGNRTLPAGMAMVNIPAGSFTMGDANIRGPLAADHIPERTVTISAFQMSEAEVTVQQYVDFLNAAMTAGIIKVADGVPAGTGTFVFGNDDQTFAGRKLMDLTGSRVLKDHDKDGDIDPENPLNQCWIDYNVTTKVFSVKDPQAVDWDAFPYEQNIETGVNESRADWPELTAGSIPSAATVATWPANFIKWYGAKVFAEFYGYDLPTEAQWEYVAKGGQNFAYGTVDGTIDATKANYNENDAHPDSGHVTPVKSYPANPFGIYDLAGNVWEWCRDWYNPGFYSIAPSTDPYNDQLVVGTTEPVEGPTFTGGPGQPYNGDARVKRGGSWNFHTAAEASANRERDYTWRGNDHFGIRIVKDGQ